MPFGFPDQGPQIAANANQGNGFWAPQSGNIAQVFQGMLGANQGIPSMLAAQQMNGVNQFGNQMQNASQQMQQQNQANQGAAMSTQGLQAGLTGKRMDDVTGLDKAMLMRPLYAGMIGGLTGALGNLGSGGGLSGFSNTNGPQAASLPAGAAPTGGSGGNAFSGSALFNAIMGANPWSPIGQSGSSFDPFGALADPADQLRKLQLSNAAALKVNPQYVKGQGWTSPGVVSPGAVY